MKKMIKVISLLLVLVMLFSVVACDFGKDDNGPDDNNGDNTGDNGGDGGNGNGDGESGDNGGAGNATVSAEQLFANLSSQLNAAKSLTMSIKFIETDKEYSHDNDEYEGYSEDSTDGEDEYEIVEYVNTADIIISEDADAGVAIYIKTKSEYSWSTYINEVKIIGGNVYSRWYYLDDDGNAPETIPQYAPEYTLDASDAEGASELTEQLIAIFEKVSENEDIESYMGQISTEINAFLDKWMKAGKIANGSWSWNSDYAAKLALLLDYVDNIDPETKKLNEFIDELFAHVLPGVTIDSICDMIIGYSDVTLSDLIDAINGYLGSETSLADIWDSLRSSEELDKYLDEIGLDEEVLATIANYRAMSFEDIVKEYRSISVDDIACYIYMMLFPSGEIVPDDGYDDIDTLDGDDGYADESGELEEMSYTEILLEIGKTMLDITLEEAEIDVQYMVYTVVEGLGIELDYGDRFDKVELGAKLLFDETTKVVSSLIFTGDIELGELYTKFEFTLTPSENGGSVTAPAENEIYSGIYGSLKDEKDGYKVSIYAYMSYLSLQVYYYDDDGNKLYYIGCYYDGSVYYGEQFEASINCYASDVRYKKPVKEFLEKLGDDRKAKVTINEDLSFTIEGFTALEPSNDIYGSGRKSDDEWYIYYNVYDNGSGYIEFQRRDLIDNGEHDYETVEYYTFRVSFDGKQEFGKPIIKAKVRASADDMRYSKAAEEFNKKYADKEITFTLNSDLTFTFGDGIDADDIVFAEADGLYGEYWESFYDEDSDWSYSVHYTYTDENKDIVIFYAYNYTTVYFIVIDLGHLEATPSIGESFTATLIADTYGNNADEINDFNDAYGATEFTVTVYEDLSVEIEDFYGIPGIDIEAE